MTIQSKYQVFIMKSPAHIPFFGAIHTWFVINDYGKLSRYEIFFRKNRCNTSNGHLHLNAFKPFVGISIIPFINTPNWPSKVIRIIEGKKAKEVGHFIENNFNTYKYAHTYKLLGPNSNTYTQWILDNFPELKIVLPKNAIGKNYNF